MENKGQALVEFVLILPLVLLILMYVVDASKIISYKTDLETDMNVIVNMYQSNKEQLDDYVTINNIEISFQNNQDLTTIIIKKQTRYTMPLLNKILGNKIQTKRVIYEKQVEAS